MNDKDRVFQTLAGITAVIVVVGALVFDIAVQGAHFGTLFFVGAFVFVGALAMIMQAALPDMDEV